MQPNLDNEEIVKALQELFPQEELKEILKGGTPTPNKKGEGEDEPEEENEETEEMDLEKAEKELADMEKACSMKKSEIETYKSKKAPKKEVEEKKDEVMKSETAVDIIKGMFSELSNEIKEVSSGKDDISKAMSAIEEIKENQNKIFKALEDFGNQPLGTKSYKNLNFIKKSEDMPGEKGKWHLTRDKSKIEKAIEDLLDSSSLSEQKRLEYGFQLMNYNSGGAPISKSLMADIGKVNDIEIIG
jgi:hypothetical protein